MEPHLYTSSFIRFHLLPLCRLSPDYTIPWTVGLATFVFSPQNSIPYHVFTGKVVAEICYMIDDDMMLMRARVFWVSDLMVVGLAIYIITGRLVNFGYQGGRRALSEVSVHLAELVLLCCVIWWSPHSTTHYISR
ncbi:uncharacterized protein B0T23DRAFT_376634 [Neurospora hispaniola]|uniref:Uncharacterized protein n=1 Tax=Neurospora hispaniola TaxID=588809 RepID=A0AAJ0I9P5_9PEZI|nr:hypothetical protein B0T23DRAFT_376634 [Neurospora hispaniola]